MSSHLEVMGVIGQVNAAFKEWQSAKSEAKKERMEAKLQQLMTEAVWIFYGKPKSLDGIK